MSGFVSRGFTPPPPGARRARRSPRASTPAEELGDDAVLTFTGAPPDGWSGHVGRIDSAPISEAADPAGTAFVCGTNGFVESAAALLQEAGVAPDRIRTERFGPGG